VSNSDHGERNKDVLLEVSQGLLLEDHLDLATGSDVNSLNSILAVSEGGRELIPKGKET
jgi:hypothetical protein